MNKIYFYIICFLHTTLVSCSTKTDVNNEHFPTILKILPDTIVNINDDYSLMLSKNFEFGRVWYSNPRLKNNETENPIDIFFNTFILELDFIVSPNNKYMVMCYIADNGFVYETEIDSFYHEVYHCDLLDLQSGIIIEYVNEFGEWNSDNKWVNSEGEILINPEELREN